MEDSLAQEIISEFHGKPVDAALAEMEMAALVLGHAAGTLDTAHERLYAALVSARQIKESAISNAR